MLADIVLDRHPALTRVEVQPLRRRAEIDAREPTFEQSSAGMADQRAADLLQPVLRLDPDSRHPRRILRAVGHVGDDAERRAEEFAAMMRDDGERETLAFY